MNLRFFSNEFQNHCRVKYPITVIFCDSYVWKNLQNWQIIRKTFVIWITVIINVLLTWSKILFLLLNIPNSSTWFNVCCSGIAMMVLSVKKRPNLKRHLLFLYLRQVFAWQWIWTVLTNWYKCGSPSSDGRFPQTAKSKNSTYSFIVFSARVGVLSTQRNLLYVVSFETKILLE